MKPLTPPVRARRAAVEVTTTAPQHALLKKHGRARTEPRWALAQRDWQAAARAYAQFNGPSAFNALVISDMCARCTLFIEERDRNGDWNETTNPELRRMLEGYENRWQNTADLIRAHSYRYSVDGEAFVCWWDGQRAVEYGVFSSPMVDVDKPNEGETTLKLIHEGKTSEETALVVPSAQVYRSWVPSHEEVLRAMSPMMSSIDDLHRYRSLTRYAWRIADSRLAMDGVFWVPAELSGEGTMPPVEIDDDSSSQIGRATTHLEEQYYELAQMSFEHNDDIAAVAPAFMSWDKEMGPPEWVEVGRGLDAAGIAHRQEAIEDAARPWPVPTTALMGGGVGDANHWSEWLASEKFVDSGVSPIMDRICHMDLTRVYVQQRLRFAGWSEEQLRDVRVGYDPTPVIVKRDKSSIALAAGQFGAIGYDAIREACGFEPADAPTDADIELMMKFLGGGGEQPPGGAPPPGAGGGLPAGPATVRKAPPSQPLVPPKPNGNGAPSPAQVAALLGSVLSEYADTHAN